MDTERISFMKEHKLCTDALIFKFPDLPLHFWNVLNFLMGSRTACNSGADDVITFVSSAITFTFKQIPNS